ncbi:MAG: HD domain-containing phosphohydrolase [Phycisphaerales bacterium]
MPTTTPPPPMDLDGYFPIDLAASAETTRGLDLYLKHHSSDQPTLYCAAGATLSGADRARLLRQGVSHLYAPLDQHHRFASALLAGLREDRASGRIETPAVRRSCLMILAESLRSESPESVQSVVDLSEALAAWLADDPATSLQLLDLAGHDYRTATHMLHVGVGAGALALRLRPGDEKLLLDAVQGGLLHDLGKRGVDERILNKQGPLAPDEWRIIKRHPEDGARRLEGCAGVRPGALEVVRDHHERLDGRGYPQGLEAPMIGLAARICAIVDVFDAVTASRPYRKPIHPLDAIDLMRDGVAAHFDVEAFFAWEEIVREGVEFEAERIVAPRHDGPDALGLAIEKILQSPPEGMPPYIPAGGVTVNEYWKSERRSQPRTPVKLRVTARIIRQGKASGLPDGEEFDMVTIDLSSGGAQVLTPWAFSKGDVLLLTIPGAEGRQIVRHARVVRVRERTDGAWSAGLEFVRSLDSEGDVDRYDAGEGDAAAA